MRKRTTVQFSEEEREILTKASKIVGDFKKALKDADAETITFVCYDGTIAEFGTFGTLTVTKNTLDSLVYPDELFLESAD